MQTSLEKGTGEDRSQKLLAAPRDEHFERQVASYKAWLAAQVRQHQSQAYHEMHAYAGRAMRAVEVSGRRIQTFAPFRYKYSSLQTITRKQIAFFVLIVLVWVSGMLWNWKVAIAWTISLITLGYLSHLVLDVFLALRAVHSPGEERIDETLLAALVDADWPPYTILCPLYKEARVVPQFVEAMKAIDYPLDKLQILFLTEEDDSETRKAIASLHLPPHFKIVTVPDGSPRTKPRACNYGLVEATGQYVVIYDAEDIPDPLQLKKAVLTFANHGPDLACVQAKLNFYNPQQNLLTRWFTAEYSLWFDLILPGLQKAKLAIPLGGTSNHFPTQTLRALGGWDAFNVTEDCDLGLRLSWFRLKTVIVDSTTYEEANSRVKNWIRQRSRWIKGYMQTYLVHMREPLHYVRHKRFRELFSLQVVIGGKTAILLINPLMWTLLALAMLFREPVSRAFASLFPSFILYIGAITLILGNFFYGYIYLLGCMKRQQYRLVKWMLLIPAYWFLASIAACMALYELFTRPHYWQKTIHGLHLKKAGETTEESTGVDQEWEEMAQLVESLTPISASVDPSLVHGAGLATRIEKYSRLEQVPVASVQDSVESMIIPRKPALPPSERAYLVRSKRTRKDMWLVATLLTAIALSIASCLYFLKQNQLLLFPEAIEQLNMAHRFVSGPSGLDGVRLGSTQLPLPYLAMSLFVWNNYLWHTGLAGSIPSMACYVVTALYVFLTVRLLTGSSLISYAGSLIFLLNPTVLYLQSTPLSELICIATLTMTCYYLLAWAKSDRLAHLLAMAGSLCLATLTRYDAWLFFAVVCLLILLTGLIKHQRREQIASNLLVFGILGALGMALWMLWCWTMFGDPISFIHTGFMSKAAQQLLPSPSTPSPYHDARQSLYVYALAALNALGPVLAGLALLAVLAFMIRWGRKPELCVALAMLALVALHLAALYTSQEMLLFPLLTSLSTQDHLLRASLGAELVAPAAIFIAALPGRWSRRKSRIPVGISSIPIGERAA